MSAGKTGTNTKNLKIQKVTDEFVQSYCVIDKHLPLPLFKKTHKK